MYTDVTGIHTLTSNSHITNASPSVSVSINDF